MPNLLNIDIEQILAWYGEAMVENRLLRLQIAQLQSQRGPDMSVPPGVVELGPEVGEGH